MIEIIEKFFAIRDKELYPPCGMWSLGHIVALIVTLLLIGVAIYFSWKKSKEEIIRSTRVMAIVVTVLELIKIGYNFINGYTWLDAWFPLAYCSLLIYSLYMCGYGKGIIQKSGQVFLSGPAFIAGMAFLLFPSTSLADHPLFHYLSFYSMFFHALMVYYTIMFYKNKIVEYKLENTKYYILFMGMFSVVAITMDYTIGCNMMFYNNPYNFPFQFIIDIYNFSNILYTILIFIAYSSMYLVVLLFDKVFKKIKREV
jgi:hypothetical protein